MRKLQRAYRDFLFCDIFNNVDRLLGIHLRAGFLGRWIQ